MNVHQVFHRWKVGVHCRQFFNVALFSTCCNAKTVPPAQCRFRETGAVAPKLRFQKRSSKAHTAQKRTYVSLVDETVYDDEEKWHGRYKNDFLLEQPELDLQYLCNPANLGEIQENIKARKGVGDIGLIQGIYQEVQRLGRGVVLSEDDVDVELEEMINKMSENVAEQVKLIPNLTHPDVVMSTDAPPRIVDTNGSKPTFAFKPKTMETLAEKLDCLRKDNLGNITGQRTYYLKNSLAEMEMALIRFTIDHIRRKGYILMSVPDLLHSRVIQNCGMITDGDRTQVYQLDKTHHQLDVSLAGTSEMALAGYHMKRTFPVYRLPRKMVAVSRCYRAEVSHAQEERGIYRVHEFTKVEMFGVTANETGKESSKLLDEIVTIQKEIFSMLGLHFVVLDMPSHELGAAAYRKYDIEAWMPGRKSFGEISSASNCTDYQSRRLHIKYLLPNGDVKHVHTVNGTGCAVPRMLIAILETYQQKDGTVVIPRVLQRYMRGEKVINQPRKNVHMKWLKFRSAQ